MAGGGLQASTCLQTALLLAVHWSVSQLAPLCPLSLYPRFLSKGSRLSTEWLGVGRLPTAPTPTPKPARQMQSRLTSYLVGSISHSKGSQLPSEPRLTAVCFFWSLCWKHSMWFGGCFLCCLDRTDLGLKPCCSDPFAAMASLLIAPPVSAHSWLRWAPWEWSESFQGRASVACPSPGI